MQNRRDISRVRTELPHALPLALDPCRLVLSCLDSYKPKAVEAPAAGKDKRREPVEPTHVRAVSLLVETLGQVLAKQAKAEGVSVPVIAPSIQEKARGILDGWVRSGGPLSKAEEASSLDAWLVLQVAAVFGVARQVDEDALLGFVAASARRKQTADMVKAMGIVDKMPVVVERLVKEGREVDAIYLAHGVDLLDSVDPVDLLKRNLREIRTLVSAMTKKDKSLQTENEATSREISMVRALIRCVDDCSLKPRFSTDHLTKRIEQLEKNRQLRKQQQAAEHSLTPCHTPAFCRPSFLSPLPAPPPPTPPSPPSERGDITGNQHGVVECPRLPARMAGLGPEQHHRDEQAQEAEEEEVVGGGGGGGSSRYDPPPPRYSGGGGGGGGYAGRQDQVQVQVQGQGQAAYSLGGAGMAGGGAIYATAGGGPGSLGQEVVYGVGTMGSGLASPGVGAGLGGGLYAAGGVGSLGSGLGGTVTYVTDAGAGPQLLVQRGMYGGEVGAAGTTVYYAVQGDQGQGGGGGGVGGGVGGAQVSAGQATYDYQTGSYVGGGYQGGYGR
ncbi:unnamed protein product [Closterium sp. Naga37s-1]|nr:unnamed protein product [Closterium sp. Naga37s-1]